ERLTGDPQEPFDGRRYGRDGHRRGVVADVAVVGDYDVQGDDVALGKDAPERRDSMDDLFVYRDAGMRRIAAGFMLVPVAGAAGAEPHDCVAAGFLQVLRGDPGPNQGLERIKHRGGDGTRFTHPGDPGMILYRYHGDCRSPSVR